MDNPFARLVELNTQMVDKVEEAQKMRLSELQERLSYAVQADLENGVAWMNDHAAAQFKEHYPMIWGMIVEILDLETIDSEE